MLAGRGSEVVVKLAAAGFKIRGPFKRDIQALKATHDILKLAMFDQFPYTEHIESGAILRKKY